MREDAAIMMSCKKSIKANHYLKNNEMADLIDQLREAEDPFTCPHGRPIIINFSNYELENYLNASCREENAYERIRFTCDTEYERLREINKNRL